MSACGRQGIVASIYEVLVDEVCRIFFDTVDNRVLLSIYYLLRKCSQSALVSELVSPFGSPLSWKDLLGRYALICPSFSCNRLEYCFCCFL